MDIVLLVGRNDQRISLYTDDIGCFYFCNQFLEVFMKKSKIKKCFNYKRSSVKRNAALLLSLSR